ncbi:MAG: chloride channel protein [Acidimicrobiia bacterium]|nr:chloride channel protein [Acidimicrobiia bacterium]MDH4307340.1 chloride channel protein [Acidimicrobiia bacterium]MDH5292872.1 chloride channel protein [Acidimicrobiia bacterium]
MKTWTRIPERGLAVLRDRETAGFLGISLLVGVGVGLGAALLVVVAEGVDAAFEWLDETLFSGAAWFVLVSVPLGVTLAWWIARRFAPEVAGDGVPEAAAALAVHGGYMSTKSIPLKILVTALTLGGGGSAGREGPIVQIGSAIGSSVSRRFHVGEDQLRSLVAAGAAAGIGASFNAPIAGMLFALEVILGSFAVRHMSSVVLASISAAVTFRSLLPAEAVLSAGSYEMGDPRELILYAGLAVVAVVAAYAFLRLLDVVERFSHQTARPAWLRPVVLGLAVGGIGMMDGRLLGTGQDFVRQLLTIDIKFEEGTGVETIAAGVLIALAVGKIVATALTVATGGSGGAFMPSLFIGAALGAGYAKIVAAFWPSSVSEIFPGAFSVVGMATVFAAVARAPLTAILIVFEVTGANDYRLVLPLMLSAAFATFVADRVHPESVYTLPLKRRGISLAKAGEIDLLDTVTVGEVMQLPKAEVSPDTPLSEVADTFDRLRSHGLPVTAEGALVGIVTVTDVQRAGGPDSGRFVRDAMTSRPVTVGPMTPVSYALERMAVLGVGRLPVVSEEHSARLVGMFRREDAISAYHLALGAATGVNLDRQRLRQRTDPGSAYFDFRVPPGSMADTAEVRQVDWQGCTLISVRRGTEVVVPTGPTVLLNGDVVTAFGTEASKRLLIDTLNESADEPTAEITIEDLLLEDE